MRKVHLEGKRVEGESVRRKEQERGKRSSNHRGPVEDQCGRKYFGVSCDVNEKLGFKDGHSGDVGCDQDNRIRDERLRGGMNRLTNSTHSYLARDLHYTHRVGLYCVVSVVCGIVLESYGMIVLNGHPHKTHRLLRAPTSRVLRSETQVGRAGHVIGGPHPVLSSW